MNWKLAELVFFLAIAAALAAMMIAFWIRTWIEEAARDWYFKQPQIAWEHDPRKVVQEIPASWPRPWYVRKADRWAALRAKRLAR